MAYRNPRYFVNGVVWDHLISDEINDLDSDDGMHGLHGDDAKVFAWRIQSGQAHFHAGDWYSTVADLPDEGKALHKKKIDSEAAQQVDVRCIPKIRGDYWEDYATRDQKQRMSCAMNSIGEDGKVNCIAAALAYNKLINGSADQLIAPESFLRNLIGMAEVVNNKWRKEGLIRGVDRSSLSLPMQIAHVQRNGQPLKKGKGGKPKPQMVEDADGDLASPRAGPSKSGSKRRVKAETDEGDGSEHNQPETEDYFT